MLETVAAGSCKSMWRTSGHAEPHAIQDVFPLKSLGNRIERILVPSRNAATGRCQATYLCDIDEVTNAFFEHLFTVLGQ